MEKQGNENDENVNTGRSQPTGLKFLGLDEKKRSKRWERLQDFFETNDHGSSLGKKIYIKVCLKY